MWGEVLEMWDGDTSANTVMDPNDVRAMQSLCTKVFAGYFWEFKEFFWECKPVSKESLMTTVFEFVAILAPAMHKKPTDVRAFEDKFVNNMGTLDCLQFMTPAASPSETNLLAPSCAPGTQSCVYRSFRTFFKGAPEEQVHNMLKLLSKQIAARMEA